MFQCAQGDLKKKKFLRVLISDFGSVLWMDPHNLKVLFCLIRGLIPFLKKFLVHLKAFSRHCYAIFMITMDSTLFSSKEYNDVLHFADAMFKVTV